MTEEKNVYSIVTPQIEQLAELCHKSDIIDSELYTRFDVKRGLRDLNGKGVLVGITEISEVNSKKFVESLEPTNNCRICLTHYPELFKEKLLDKGIDIAFTGHAHGGIIRLPFIGGIYSRGEGFLPDLTEGVVTATDGTKVVISRGLGDSCIIPRINNRPELVVVDICWY